MLKEFPLVHFHNFFHKEKKFPLKNLKFTGTKLGWSADSHILYQYFLGLFYFIVFLVVLSSWIGALCWVIIMEFDFILFDFFYFLAYLWIINSCLCFNVELFLLNFLRQTSHFPHCSASNAEMSNKAMATPAFSFHGIPFTFQLSKDIMIHTHLEYILHLSKVKQN